MIPIMSKTKKALFACCLIAALLLTGCHPLVPNQEKALNIYATFYPIYALTEELMRDVPDAELHCLVQPQDGCLRSYQLSDWDLYLLSTADAILCGGRGLESFEDVLFSLGKSGHAVSALLYNLNLYKGEAHSEREDSHLSGDNPHLYMSISGAKQLVEAICGTLMTLDQRYALQYQENEAKATAALEALEAETRELMEEYAGESVVIMNEALIYLCTDYGLNIADCVERESGEAFYGEQIEQLIQRLKATGTSIVLTEKQTPVSLTSTLEEAGFHLALLDVMSTHTEADGFDAYLEIQKNNACAIAQAFEEAQA